MVRFIPVFYLVTNATSTDGFGSLLSNAIGPIIGGLLALTGSFLVYYFTNKAAERRHNEQLDREDKKKALRQLSELLNSPLTTAYEWSKKITDFLYSYDGGFIPTELSKRVSDEMYSIQKRLETINPEYALTEEEIQSIIDEQNALYHELPEHEAELEVIEHVKKVKADFVQQIRASPLGTERSSLGTRIRKRLRLSAS